MGNYKIPQDVEAEDKLLGPFTFRQFIFLLIAAAAIFVAWLLAKINGWLTLIPLPVVLVFGFLGVYHREDQPVEIYLLAALNFFLKPRKRVWDPEGKVENVKLIAPPRQSVPKLKQLETEERGQLQKLAHIMDTRGWSIKRPELNEAVGNQAISYDDRLVAVNAASQDPLDIHLSDDVLDPINFPDAQKYRQLAEGASKDARAQAIAKMRQAAATTANPPAPAATKPTPSAIKYQPYPNKIKQTHLDPQGGQLTPKTSTVPKPLPPPTPAAASPHLSVHQLAQQARRQKAKAGEFKAGQPFDLTQGKAIEIDLPNTGEPAA